ncbi:hypothetical protein QQ008_00485 [Fulvivirgaceae bacterium BMA10]|uniref:Uncharacterized protein n=1 Tax=Splendidivirga corallicola TaxID=3051826 RepID=A0ABT8KGH7_9BACT|nr:hypothetical protein [Fulvivirgaceae bacterium BMA10]
MVFEQIPPFVASQEIPDISLISFGKFLEDGEDLLNDRSGS